MRVPKLTIPSTRRPRVPGIDFRSVSSLLSIGLAVAFWLLAIATALVGLLFLIIAFLPLEQVQLTFSETQIPVGRAYMLFGIGAAGAYVGGFAMIVRQLRHIVRTLRIGDPFHPSNAGRLKQIGLILVVVTSGTWMVQTVISRFSRGDMEAPSVFDLVTPAFSVLVIIVLTAVFREGARLRRESELTI